MSADNLQPDPSPNGNHNGVVSTLHEWARIYAENGVAVFPCYPRRKRPLTRNGFHEATTDLDQIDAWWRAAPEANVAQPLGANGVFALDVDGPAGRAALSELEKKHGPLPTTYQVVTGRAEGDGRHHIFRQPSDGRTVRNRQLGDHLETRGDGGYIVAPPSIHPSGRPYLAIGMWSDIVDAPDWLLDLATRDKQQDTPQPPIATVHADTDSRYGQAALRNITATLTATPIGRGLRHNAIRSAAMQIAGLVNGGHLTETAGYAALIAGCAAIGRPDHDDPKEVDNAWRGALDKAEPHQAAPLEPIGPTLVTPPPVDLTYRTDDPRTDDQNTTRDHPWATHELDQILDGTYQPPQPTVLGRDDTVCLLYPAATNAIFGESESGKSWIALHAAAQQLNRGAGVVYIDFEASAPVIVTRLLALGVPADPIRTRFGYINPQAPIDDDGQQHLRDTLARLQPDLVVLDGITGAMGLHGWDPLSNADAEKFDRLLPRPLAHAGAAVLMIDHVTKTRGEGSAGNYAMGAQHKRAAITGAAYRVDTIPGHQIAPGRTGKLRLTISKDRHGAIRAKHPTQAGWFHLDSSNPDQPRARIEAPHDPGGPFRPTALMEKVSRALEDAHEPLTKNEIADRVGGKKKYALQAVDVLVGEGYVTERKTANGHLHTSVRPYRDEEG